MDRTGTAVTQLTRWAASEPVSSTCARVCRPFCSPLAPASPATRVPLLPVSGPGMACLRTFALQKQSQDYPPLGIFSHSDPLSSLPSVRLPRDPASCWPCPLAFVLYEHMAWHILGVCLWGNLSSRTGGFLSCSWCTRL